MTTKQRTATSRTNEPSQVLNQHAQRKTGTTVEPPDPALCGARHNRRKTDNAKPTTKNTENNCLIHRYTPERRPDTTQTRKNPHKMGKLDSNQKWNNTYSKPKQKP
jgi:hypothetical protein